jgi:hypothetical protein
LSSENERVIHLLLNAILQILMIYLLQYFQAPLKKSIQFVLSYICKVKKTAVIFLLLMYGSSTMGATIHLHYCMNDFVGWSLWHSKDDKCGKCGMKEKKGGCCKDEHKQIKLKTVHQKSTVAQYIQLVAAPAVLSPVAVFAFKAVAVTIDFPVSNAPPKIPRERLYIFNCIFLI